MKTILWIMTLLFLIALLLPQKANSDYIIPEPITTPQLVEVIEVAFNLKTEEQKQNYLLVYEEFKNEPLMISIAMAESRFYTRAKNPSSTASGLFQILKGTFLECSGDVFNPHDNIACARILYDKYGTTPWDASKSVWEYTK